MKKKIDVRVRAQSVKNVITLLICFVLLSGCGEQHAPNPETKKHTVGIILFGDSRMPQVEGFKDGMAKLGYEENKSIKYIIRNAKNKRDQLKPIINELLEEKVDLLVAAGGLEADTIKKISPNDTPVVVLYINAIIERGLVKSQLEPGWGVTGIDNLNAELSSKRVEIMRDLLPSLKKILILYYEKIAPSRIGVEKATIMANKLGIAIDARAVSSREEIREIMTKLKPGEVDAMLTVPTAPIDNALKKIILPEINRLKLPLFTHSRPLAEKGALASYGAHFYDMGMQASRLAKKILTGTDASKIPFETPKKYVYAVNKDVQTEFGIVIPSMAKSQINEYITREK